MGVYPDKRRKECTAHIVIFFIISDVNWREQMVSDLYLLAPWETAFYLGMDWDDSLGNIGQYCQSFYR